jgi:hypothetical protein
MLAPIVSQRVTWALTAEATAAAGSTVASAGLVDGQAAPGPLTDTAESANQ